MKHLFSLAICLIALISCGASKDEPGGGGSGQGETTVDSNITSTLTTNLSTDKAFYRPGETVTFTADKVTSDAKIRYRHGAEVISEEAFTSKTWTWKPPTTDFKGYMVDIYQAKADGTENILGTIAVDVSSSWKKFPRYGFIATFGKDKTESVIDREMKELCRYHINGVQFQDWHYKHHWPLGGTRDNLMDTYKDIANRTIYTSTVKNYIAAQHKYGMNSIFYNLCYGALDEDGAEADGVKPTWYMFKDRNHSSKDYHELLPIGWKSNIYLLDPSNTEWQAYIAQRNDDVYANLDFDGYQIDQLGARGARFNYSGNEINMGEAFASFIKAMKKAHPSKALVMNSVSNYGAQNISTSEVDFCYNELWDGEKNFADLYNTIKINNCNGKSSLATVFAAYMNYGLSNASGYFNTPGVILTDAVIFAIGGAHLELGGDHMLGSEYFPNNNLKMKSALKTAMIRYYDFATAYENLLRDGGNENSPSIKCTSSQKVVAWGGNGPQKGNVVTFSKKVDGKQVISLLNFVKANDLSWRDYNGTMPEPSSISNMSLTIGGMASGVKKVWMASPDQHGGVVQELKFTQSGNEISVTIPRLKYWDMLVIE